MVSAISTSAIFFAVAYAQTTDARIRLLTSTAGVAAISIVPYTTVTMLPINNELVAMVNSKALESTKFTAATESRAESLLEKWRRLHFFRVVMGGGAWAAALYALILSERASMTL